MPNLENRFEALENFVPSWEEQVDNLNTVALAKVQDVLGPLLEQLQTAQDQGFLVTTSTLQPENTMVVGESFGLNVNAANRACFAPTPVVMYMDIDDPTNWGLGTVQTYDNVTGDLTSTISYTAKIGQAGTNWSISDNAAVWLAVMDLVQTTLDARDEVVMAQTDFADQLDTLQTLIDGLSAGAVVSVNGQTGVAVVGVGDIPAKGIYGSLVTGPRVKDVSTCVNTQRAAH